jgi:alkanesulfonate monooxygenase SsuD/methylene tetrahydromethanopterin reductase-like flavin-dependent oxidoreductase (luciferase family)
VDGGPGAVGPVLAGTTRPASPGGAASWPPGLPLGNDGNGAWAVYLAALTSQNVELAGEIADGVMPLWWSAERVARSKRWVDRGRAKSGRGKPEMTLGLPTYVGDDIGALREAARANLAIFTTLPFFQRLMRASGFADEAHQAEQGAAGASLSDRLLDAICLIGPAARCRERIAQYRDAGLDLPILWPGLGIDSAREVIAAFRQ